MALFRRKKKDSNEPGQLAVLKDAFKLVKKHKPIAFLWSALSFVFVLIVGISFGSSINHPVYLAIVSLPLGLLVAFFIFTRQANSAAFGSIENQLGAAGSVIMAIRSGFTVTPGVAINKNQDMVHRAVGRCGVVLVGEGSNGVRTLLTDEVKKVERFVPGVPVTTLIVGDGEGRVAINKLQRTMKKLPKQISNTQLREVRNRLKAVGGLNMPIPKGPMPKNLRVPKM